MDTVYESLARQDKLRLGAMVVAGLTLLAAVLWDMAPAMALLLVAPAVAAGVGRLAVTPVYGLRMDAHRLLVMGDAGDTVVTYDAIAHLRLEHRADAARATLVLRDGTDLEVPLASRAAPFDLIRAATDRGIPVRTA